MNSFQLAARRTQALASRRFFSKGSSIPTSSAVEVDGVKVVGLPHLSTSSMKWAYRQKHWLSDPASYPLIAILGGAGCFAAGFIIYFTATSPDVQVSPLKRNKTIRDWS